MKKKKAELVWLPVSFMTGVIIEILLIILGKGNMVKDIANLVVMITFFCIVATVFFLAYHYLRIGNKLRDGFSQAVLQIRMLHSDGDNNVLERLCEDEVLFHEEHLDAAFQKFKDEFEVSKIKISEEDEYGFKVDIEEYIHYGLIDEIIHSHFLGQISGAMTGLGILGTFVGLSIGLNSFDLTGTATEVEGKIQPLMEGIKVAFHTSICGLIYSMLFNYFYRENYIRTKASLDEFLEAFHSFVVPSTENGSKNTFLKYQEQIFRRLNSQLKLQKSSIEDQRKMNRELNKELSKDFSRELSEKISEKMSEVIVPSVEKMTKAVENFAEESKEYQIREVEKIVDRFLMQMNSALGISFQELRDIMSKTNEWQNQSLSAQETSLSEIQKVLTEIVTMSVNLKDVNQELRNSMSFMTAFQRNMEELQDKVIENMTNVVSQTELSSQQMIKQSEIFNEIMQQEENMNKTMTDFSKTIILELKEQSKYSVESIEIIGKKISETAEKEMEGISTEAKHNVEALSNVVKTQLDIMIKDLGVEISRMSEIIDTRISKMSENMGIEFEKLSEKIGKMSEIVGTETDRMSEGVRMEMGQLSEEVKNQMIFISKSVKNDLEKSAELIASQTQQGSKAIEEEMNIVAETAKEIQKGWKTYNEEQITQMQQIGEKYRNNIPLLEKDVKEIIERLEKVLYEKIQDFNELEMKNAKAIQKLLEQLQSILDIETKTSVSLELSEESEMREEKKNEE